MQALKLAALAALLALSLLPMADATPAYAVTRNADVGLQATQSCTIYHPLTGACFYGDGHGSSTCTYEFETNCNHVTAPDRCILYVGGPDGSCIVY